MPKMFKGPTPQETGAATEDFRIYIDDLLSDFLRRPNMETYSFQPDLSNELRKYIHQKCQKLGLKSKSRGKGAGRYLTIFKVKPSEGVESFDVGLSKDGAHILRENHELLRRCKALTLCNNSKRRKVQQSPSAGNIFGRLMSSPLCQVNSPNGNALMTARANLPIFASRDLILQKIEDNNVLIVSAETGSGKTTQIPQFILDDALERQRPVKVICTQPRRLSTIAVCDRVAAERGEKMGYTVGYQIKLESNVGFRTSLIYCTNGVLLRTLMSGDQSLRNVTHVIVDEIHERDKYTDFLMICLREALMTHPHLKVILMSATMDMEAFQGYFTCRPGLTVDMIKVSGRNYKLTSWFLDDILLELNYETAAMRDVRQIRERNGGAARRDDLIVMPQVDSFREEVDDDLAEDLNEAIEQCFSVGTNDSFAQLMQLLLSESVSPDYQETEGMRTPLMAAAYRGRIDELEQLLNLGANPFLSCANGITASGYAQQGGYEDVVRLLSMYQMNEPRQGPVAEVSRILADYDRTAKDDTVDYNLVAAVVKYIHTQIDQPGAILVFLPGYDDIVTCKETILRSGINGSELGIYMLHSSMQISAQHGVFARMPRGKRKVVLSTNLAETSLTIDDVCYVIDTGKSKQKSYDIITGISSLRTDWISMASAMQRAGRAGRTSNGHSFHLYSKNRYNSLAVTTTPEILRVPLHELCLQTKMLAPKDMSIQNFLNLAIEPPHAVAVTNSINVLKTLDALDHEEELTPLGKHLVQLSLEPHLGKMLIYGVIFKCLDPVLTIVSCLAHKDPFILPTSSKEKAIATNKRKELCEDSLSDHLALLRAYQQWQQQLRSNCGGNRAPVRFCDEFYLSSSTMDLILLTRSQLLSQLRAMYFVPSHPKDYIGELNRNSDCWPIVKGCLAVGFYPNVAFYNEKENNNRKLHTRLEKHVQIGMQSCVRNSRFAEYNPQDETHKCWLVFEEISKNNVKCSIKNCTAVTPLTIALLCGLKVNSKNTGSIVMDDWFELNFYNNEVSQLRAVLERIIKKKIEAPQFRLHVDEDSVVDLVPKLVLAEDLAYTLSCPKSVGQRPLLMYNRISGGDRYHGGGGGGGNQHGQAGPSHGFDHRRHYYNSNQNHGFHDPSAGVLSPHNRYPHLFSPHSLYFIIRPFETKNVMIGIQQGLWNFAPQTEKKLFRHFNEGSEIILIFCVRGASYFHGVARLVSTNNGYPNQPCQICWLTTNTLTFEAVKTYIHQRLHITSDGQELESNLGQRLCSQLYDSYSRPPRHRPILGKSRDGSYRPPQPSI